MLRRLVTSKKLLVIVPVVLALALAGLFLPARKVSIEPFGMLSLESKITISIGYEVAYASPDTERQSPDVLIVQTNLTGAVTDIQDDLDSPDANWLTAIDERADTVCRVSFPTPTGNPTVGAGLQEFKIWVRMVPADRDIPTVRIDLYDAGVFKATVLAATSVTSATGQLFSATWDASLLADATGAGVECYIYGTLTAKETVEVGAVEWNVTYTPPPSISNTPNTWDFGTLSTSSTTETGITYVLDSSGFRITNNSLFPVNITISATNMTGGVTWTLSDTATQGPDTYGLKAGTSDTGDYTITVTSSGVSLKDGLLATTSIDWGLQLLAPTSFSDGGLKSGTVTLTATQA